MSGSVIGKIGPADAKADFQPPEFQSSVDRSPTLGPSATGPTLRVASQAAAPKDWNRILVILWFMGGSVPPPAAHNILWSLAES